MEKVTLIIRKTYNDDGDASTNLDIKVATSVESAKKILLDELNKGWGTNCKTLGELANLLLDSDLEDANSKEISSTCEFDFYWYDNGKGEEFSIAEVGYGNEYTNIVTGV